MDSPLGMARLLVLNHRIISPRSFDGGSVVAKCLRCRVNRHRDLHPKSRGIGICLFSSGNYTEFNIAYGYSNFIFDPSVTPGEKRLFLEAYAKGHPGGPFYWRQNRGALTNNNRHGGTSLIDRPLVWLGYDCDNATQPFDPRTETFYTSGLPALPLAQYRPYQSYFLTFPNWLWMFIFFLSPALWTIGLVRQKRRRKILRGCCAKCGYDLRASKDRCPECGAPFPRTPASTSTNSAILESCPELA